MSNKLIFDLVIAALLLSFAVFGGIKGFFKSIMSMLTFWFALLGSVRFSSVFAPALAEKLSPYLLEKFISKIDVSQFDFDLSAMGIDLSKYVAGSNMLDGLSQSIKNAITISAADLVLSLSRVLLFIVFFLLITLVCKLFIGLVDKLFALPVLKTFNYMGGFILGFVEGALIIWLVVYIEGLLGLTWFHQNAEGTILMNIFANHSPFELMQMLR